MNNIDLVSKEEIFQQDKAKKNSIWKHMKPIFSHECLHFSFFM